MDETFLENSIRREREEAKKDKIEPCFCTETRCDNYGMKYCTECGMMEPEFRDEHGTRQRTLINQFQGVFVRDLNDHWYDRTELEKWRLINEFKHYFG